MRVNHNNSVPSYLQQLSHLTESCKWLSEASRMICTTEHNEHEQIVSGHWLFTNAGHAQEGLWWCPIKKVKHEKWPCPNPARVSFFCLVVEAHVEPALPRWHSSTLGLIRLFKHLLYKGNPEILCIQIRSHRKHPRSCRLGCEDYKCIKERSSLNMVVTKWLHIQPHIFTPLPARSSVL